MKNELKFRNRNIYKYENPQRNMKRSVLFLPLLLLGIVFLFPLISSANTLTLTTPTANVLIDGTYNISATYDTMTQSATNVSFYYCTGACASWTLIGTNANLSANDTYYSVSWDTTSIVDNDTIVINASGVNWTNYFLGSDNNSGISVDNGLPTTTFSSASASYDSKIKQAGSVTYGLDADSSIGISSCIISFTNRENNDVFGTSMTTSGNACSNTSISPLDIGLLKGNTYDVRIQATDGNGNQTNSSIRRLGILTSPGGVPSVGVAGPSVGVAQSFVKSIGKVFTPTFWSDFWDWITFWN